MTAELHLSRFLSFPRSAWECTGATLRVASSIQPLRATGRRASGRAFPRGAWERGRKEESRICLNNLPKLEELKPSLLQRFWKSQSFWLDVYCSLTVFGFEQFLLSSHDGEASMQREKVFRDSQIEWEQRQEDFKQWQAEIDKTQKKIDKMQKEVDKMQKKIDRLRRNAQRDK